MTLLCNSVGHSWLMCWHLIEWKLLSRCQQLLHFPFQGPDWHNLLQEKGNYKLLHATETGISSGRVGLLGSCATLSFYRGKLLKRAVLFNHKFTFFPFYRWRYFVFHSTGRLCLQDKIFPEYCNTTKTQLGSITPYGNVTCNKFSYVGTTVYRAENGELAKLGLFKMADNSNRIFN